MKVRIQFFFILIMAIIITPGCGDGTAFDITKNFSVSAFDWNNTISFTYGRAGHTSVAANGYIYVMGGYGGTWKNDVQYASVNSDGRVGSWNTTTSFATPRSAHASVVYNGYVYIIGGDQNATRLNDVQYAKINENGTLTSWNTTTSFSTARYGHTSVAYNGYLYVIGGLNASAYDNSVQYAPINENGTIGSWATTTSFNIARYYHSSVVYNGFLYVIGGNNNYDGVTDDSFNTVQYAPVNSDGTIGSWSETNPFNTARRCHVSVVYNGYIYIIGGHVGVGSSTYEMNDIQYAKINTDGSLGSWNTAPSFNNARSSHTGVINGEYLYILGGHDGTAYLANGEYASFGR